MDLEAWHKLFVDVYGQLRLISDTNFGLIVILSVIASLGLREVMNGATLLALVFLPGFILGGCLSAAIFPATQVFLTADSAINTVVAAIVGIMVALIVMLLLRRALAYVGDVINRVA